MSVAIVGARGYTGGELISLLTRHPHLRLKAAFSRSPGTPLGASMPPLAALARGSDNPRAIEYAAMQFTAASPAAVRDLGADVVLLALPNGASGEYVDALAESPSTTVVDLSADGRFSPDKYAYGLPEVKDNRKRLTQSPHLVRPKSFFFPVWHFSLR